MCRFSLPFGLIVLLTATAPAADVKTDYDHFRERLKEVNRKLQERLPVLVTEIDKGLIIPSKKADAPVELPKPLLDRTQVTKLLSGKVGQPQLAELVQKLSLAQDYAAPASAGLRAKLVEYSRPVSAVEAKRDSALAEYNRMLDLGWEIDLWGYVEPRGTLGEAHREVYRQWQAAEVELKAARKEADRKVREDRSEGMNYDSLDALQKAFQADFKQYRATVPSAVAIRRLLAEVAVLIAERDRLEEFVASGSLWVVWTNDVGWVHVGPHEVFEKGKWLTKRDEVWGGKSTDPLVSKLVLDAKGYKTSEEAIKAVAAALGKVERRESPRAAPQVYYVGTMDGEKKIGFEIVNHPAFQKSLPPEKK